MVTSMLRHSNAHPEWVLIPGTALWEYRWAQPTSFQRQNTAPVFHGGQLVHAYCKKYPGDTELAVGTAWSTDYPLGNVPSDPVFEIDGVHFGIDICNDYRRGAFARYFDKTGAPAFGPGLPPWVAQYNAKPGVDVHLLTASGVSPMSARTYLPLENAAP
jgi:predicted amidohydrolase